MREKYIQSIGNKDQIRFIVCHELAIASVNRYWLFC